MRQKIIAWACVILVCGAGPLLAEALTSTSQHTTMNAAVCDQAEVSVPSSVYFLVTDVADDTVAADNTVSATSVVLEDGEALRVEIQADAADFSGPTGALVVWAATDVSWNAPAWTGGTGMAGTLSSAAYTKVAESDTNAATLSTAALQFSLAAKATVDHAGDYDLSATWRFSNFTP